MRCTTPVNGRTSRSTSPANAWGVVGTGSSGIQSIPEIAAQAEELFVFQRTPNFSVPAKNGPLDQQLWADVKANYPQLREDARHTPTGLPFSPGTESALGVDEETRKGVLDEHWALGGFRLAQCFSDIGVSREANDTIAAYIRAKIDEIVEDPAIAELLKPWDHPVGTKRICVDTDYYATYNRDNVHLIDVKSAPITTLTETGLRTEAGEEFELDAVVFATGFDAMTGVLLSMDIRGRDGESLRDRRESGARTYLGLSVAGFPNLFTVTGPGSPSVLSHRVTSIEQHVEWIDEHIAYLRRNGLEVSEPGSGSGERVGGARQYGRRYDPDEAGKLLVPACRANPGSSCHAGGVGAYRQQCDEIAAGRCRGFQLA